MLSKSRVITTIFIAMILLTSLPAIFSMNYDGDSREERLTQSGSRGTYPFSDHYPTVSEIYGWYDELETNYSDLVKKINYGQSYEGRDLFVMKISDNVDVNEDEPEVLINGGTHAREWSGHQTSAYFMWRILDEYDTNDTIHWLINNREIFVAVVVNPDGYIYDGNGDLSAYEGAGWRKNRNDSTPTEAVGVDLNRNWDIDWENGNDDESADDYHGEAPFSEPETKYFSDWMKTRDIESYQDIHSFAGTLLIPWCYTGDPSPHDSFYRETAKDMTSLTSMLGDNSSHYTYGQPDETIGYSASGGSIDWVYDELGAQGYCFEIETGGSQFNAGEGFHPPEEDIMTINRDVDDALIYQARIADLDLGDGIIQLIPPNPYLVYGTVSDSRAPIEGEDVLLENENTGETISVETDSNGYYELNLGLLTENGYSDSDPFRLLVGGTSETFTIGEEWGQRIDLDYIPPKTQVMQMDRGWHFISTRLLPKNTSLTAILDDSTNGIPGNYDKVMSYQNPYELVTKGAWRDGFETDIGWTFSGGEWERGAPQGLAGDDSYGEPDPSAAFNGTNVLGYDLTGNGDYEEGMSSTYWATSPSIDLGGYSDVSMNFERWLGVQGSGYDHAYIEVYDGSTWVQIWENPSSTLDGGSWEHTSYDVSTWADDNSNFQVRFGMGPTNSGGWLEDGQQYCGWNIDDFELTYQTYEATGEMGTWKTYVPGREAHYNTLDDWDYKVGIWIHVDNSDQLTIEGYELSDNCTLIIKPGWNMVGYPSNITGNNNLPSAVDKIGYFDSNSPYDLAYDYDPGTFSFTPGDAYWIHNPTNECLTWEIDY